MSKLLAVRGYNSGLLLGLAFLVTIIGCKSDPDAGKYSKTVTFSTPEPAPKDFDAWSFQWSTPRWDGKAQLNYIVRLPDGSTYFQADIPQHDAWNPPTDGKIDFGVNYAGGDPSAFFGKTINVTFRVDKGSLLFSPDRFYTFKFYKGGFEGTLLTTQSAVMDGG